MLKSPAKKGDPERNMIFVRRIHLFLEETANHPLIGANITTEA